VTPSSTWSRSCAPIPSTSSRIAAADRPWARIPRPPGSGARPRISPGRSGDAASTAGGRECWDRRVRAALSASPPSPPRRSCRADANRGGRVIRLRRLREPARLRRQRGLSSAARCASSGWTSGLSALARVGREAAWRVWAWRQYGGKRARGKAGRRQAFRQTFPNSRASSPRISKDSFGGFGRFQGVARAASRIRFLQILAAVRVDRRRPIGNLYHRF